MWYASSYRAIVALQFALKLLVTCGFNPLTPTVAIMGTAIKHPVPDRVEPSFVIFDIRTL